LPHGSGTISSYAGFKVLRATSNKITMIGESPPAMKMAGARSAERRLEEPGKRAEFVRGAKARK
jgi:hypothetical protein